MANVNANLFSFKHPVAVPGKNPLFKTGGLFGKLNPVATAPKEPANEMPEEPTKAVPVANDKAEAVGVVDTVEEVKDAETKTNEADTKTAEKTASLAIVTEKKKRKAKAKAEKSDKAEKAEDPEEAVVAQTADPDTGFVHAKFEPEKLSLAKVRKVFSVTLEDPEWETTKASLQERTSNIRIAEDINYGAAKLMLAQCTNLYSELRNIQSENKKLYDRLNDKVLGLIPRQEQLNAVGKNNEERKMNSLFSVESFFLPNKDGGKFNLFDVSMIVIDRMETVNAMLDDVKQKKESLVSLIALMKLEAGALK